LHNSLQIVFQPIHSINRWQMDRQRTDSRTTPKHDALCLLLAVIHARSSLTGSDILLMLYNNSIKTHARRRHYEGSNNVLKHSEMSQDICCSYVIITSTVAVIHVVVAVVVESAIVVVVLVAVVVVETPGNR